MKVITIKTKSVIILAAVLSLALSGCSKNAVQDKESEVNNLSESGITETESVSGYITDEINMSKPQDIEYSESIGVPEFSCDTGFYSDDFELELNSGNKDAEIRFTLDGSIPDINSQLYTEKINIINRSGQSDYLSYFNGIGPEETAYIPSGIINKATVVRAALFSSDGVSGPVVTNTYFTGLNQNSDYNSLPVISLSTNPYNLFDYEEGIYVAGKTFDEWNKTDEARDAEYWECKGNYTQKGREWERPVHMELIEPDGTVHFEQDLGMRIMGKASRTYNQKSFRIYAREEYEAKKIEYPLIPEAVVESDGSTPLEKYKTFLLRNGGNDCDYVKLRDPFIQKIVQGKNIATQDSRPAVVFINGEYWGLYAVEEDYTDKYIQYNYDVDSKDVVLIKTDSVDEGTEEDLGLYEDLKLLFEADLSDPENYEKLCSSIDIQNAADYYSILIYTANEDCILKKNANWRIWRSRTISDAPYYDGKWRFMLYDTEFSLGLYKDGETSRLNSFKLACDSSWFGSLMNNEDFRNLFVSSLRDTAERFKPENSFSVLDELASLYGPAAPDCFMKFGPQWLTEDAQKSALVNYYDQGIDMIKQFLTERYDYTETMINEVISKY